MATGFEEELEKAEAAKTDVVCFANDLPSPEKWEACKNFISGLDKLGLCQQAGNVLKALHLEDIASYWACGDVKARSRLCDILRELECRLGQHLVKECYVKTLERNQRENDFYEANDCDGLLKEGFIDAKEHDTLQNVWGRDSAITAAVKTIESV
ncbi:MAG: hypothetical protein ABFC88_13465 [Thermoguttaceae bacterium]